VRCCSGCFEILFMCLLRGAGPFICLLAVCACSVVGSHSVISAALVAAVREVSGCRPCIGRLFVVVCLLFKFMLVPRVGHCR
jgi:hypothetical protein